MKIAITMAVIGVIIGEFISAQAGLGFYILYASSRMETAVIFAALFVLCVIGVAVNHCFLDSTDQKIVI
jgi:NitT/TauT family transport system permease protein